MTRAGRVSEHCRPPNPVAGRHCWASKDGTTCAQKIYRRQVQVEVDDDHVDSRQRLMPSTTVIGSKIQANVWSQRYNGSCEGRARQNANFRWFVVLMVVSSLINPASFVSQARVPKGGRRGPPPGELAASPIAAAQTGEAVTSSKIGTTKIAPPAGRSRLNRRSTDEGIIEANATTSLSESGQTEVCDVNEDRELAGKERELEQMLAKYYSFQPSNGTISSKRPEVDQSGERRLPRPRDVQVETKSYYPPVLKLSWSMNWFSEVDARQLDLYESATGSDDGSPMGLGGENRQLDWDLALELEPSGRIRDELRARRELLRQSLSYFQVTYKIINSRFKVIEEYPAYLRDITLERLLPTTEYSLQVVAVYLNKYHRPSARVQFVTPTDNESRRFKENTYRPIHRYPDEEEPLRYGFELVRGEELTIVAIALLFWIATICLFFNKWGKIRMLEPYQPAYRDTVSAGAVSASFGVAGHHHASSIHNLSASSLLPAGTGMGVAGGQNRAASPTTGSGAPTTGGDEAAPTSGTRLSHLHQAGGGGSEGVARKSSRSLALLAGRRRYETIADESPMRNYAELNCLFQSKAQALAKAQIWSRFHQSSLQTQTCSPAATSSANLYQGASGAVPAARRLNSLLRQRQMSQGLAGGQAPLPADQVGAGGSLDQLRSGRAGSSSSSHQRASAREGGPTHEATDSDERLVGGDPASAPSANKLRRLLFMSRSHQHHHLATSTSSSTTLVLAPAVVQVASGSEPASLAAAAAAGSGPGTPTPNPGENSRPPTGNSVSLDEGQRAALVAATTCNTTATTNTQSSLSSTCLSAHFRLSTSSFPVGSPCSQSGWKRSRTPAGRQVQHHILIEPPSPPPEKLNRSDLSSRQNPQPDEQRPAIFFEEVAPAVGRREITLIKGVNDTDEEDLDEDADEELRYKRAENAFSKLARYQASLQQMRNWELAMDQPGMKLSGANLGRESAGELELSSTAGLRPRMSSVFVASPYSRGHRGSFAMLRALSQKKSKSAEDVAHLSSLVLQIWARNRNPLLQSVNQLDQSGPRKGKSSLTASHL